MVTGCRNPFIRGGLAFPCGRCEPCLGARQQVWSHRLQLEAMCHESSTFVTLTYADDRVPRTVDEVPTLAPEDVQKFLKRLRHAGSFRFYLVGEYGDKTHRPHYHLVLFGFQPCIYGRTRRDAVNDECRSDCCSRCRLVHDTWAHGIVELGEVNKDSCDYICKYLLKRMTRYDDPRLNGRNPEFCRSSNRRGIGFGSVDVLAGGYRHWFGDRDIDVSYALQSGTRRKPLGRYLVNQLRIALGKLPGARQETLDAMEAELLPLYVRSIDNKTSFKTEVMEAGKQRYENYVARVKLYQKRGSV